MRDTAYKQRRNHTRNSRSRAHITSQHAFPFLVFSLTWFFIPLMVARDEYCIHLIGGDLTFTSPFQIMFTVLSRFLSLRPYDLVFLLFVNTLMKMQ